MSTMENIDGTQRDAGPRRTEGGRAEHEGGVTMKKHRFWAWASIFCAAMTLYTGYRHL